MDASYSEVRDALGYISPSQERDEWWKIGAAIKNEFGDGGFELFDQWSQGGDSYDAKDVRSTWTSTKANGSGTSIKIGTLFKLAQDNGYRPRTDRNKRISKPARPVVIGNAKDHWDHAEDCASHPYAEAKGLDTIGLKKYKGRLLIFDPLSAYLGVKDSHRDADVRQVLGPLTELAARHGVAVLGITHLSKNAANSAMARFMGSTGIIAASRAAFLATRHEEELLLLPVKNNLAPIDTGGFTYRIKGETVADDITTSCIEWTGQTDIEADDALAQQAARRTAPKMMYAIEFLNELLQDGPVSLDDITKAAELEGITWATVRRAYDELNIESIKEKKFQGKWIWHTPEQAARFKAQEMDP